MVVIGLLVSSKGFSVVKDFGGFNCPKDLSLHKTGLSCHLFEVINVRKCHECELFLLGVCYLTVKILLLLVHLVEHFKFLFFKTVLLIFHDCVSIVR